MDLIEAFKTWQLRTKNRAYRVCKARETQNSYAVLVLYEMSQVVTAFDLALELFDKQVISYLGQRVQDKL